VSFFVRTGNGGVGPDVFIRDLGITISTSGTFIEISAYNSAGFSIGQFAVEELVSSEDLYNAIVSFELEASTDGYTNNVDGYTYSPIFPMANEIGNSQTGINLTNSALVLPNTTDAVTLILNPKPGQVAFDVDDGYIVFYDGYGWKQVGEGSDVSTGGTYTGVQNFSGAELIIPNGTSLPGQPATIGRLFLLNDSGVMKLYASDGAEWDIIGPTFGGGVDTGLWFLDGYLVQLIEDGYILRVDEVEFGDGTQKITSDGYGNLLFIDQANPSGLTLSDLFAGGTGGFNPGYLELVDGYILKPIDDGYVLRATEYQIVDGQIQIKSDGYGNLLLQDISGVTSLTALKSMRNVWISSSSESPGNLTLSDSINWGAQYVFIGSINVETSSTNWDLWICETSAFDISAITSKRIVRKGLRNTLVDVSLEVNSDSNNLYLIYADNASGSNVASFYVTGEARRH